MLKVALCEDDLIFAKFEKNTIINLFTDEIEQVDIFTNINDFFSVNYTDYNVLLLDIKLGDQDGYEIARKLNEKGSTCFVIVVTSFESTARFGYEHNVFRFIRKIDFESDIERSIKAILTKCHKNRQSMLLKYKGVSYHFRYSDIMYVVSINNYLIIKTANKSDFKFRIILKSIQGSLEDNGLVKINRGIMLNCKYLEYLDYKSMQAFLTNGEHVKVSKAGISQINNAIIEGE